MSTHNISFMEKQQKSSSSYPVCSMLQMYKYKRTDFIETDLKSQLMESLEHHMVTMEIMRKDFEKYRSRLSVVRQEKEKARLELLGKYCQITQLQDPVM